MKVIQFNIPSFEEWMRCKRDVRKEFGAYRIEIRESFKRAGHIRYMFALSPAKCNGINVYTDRLFSKSFDYYGDNEKLKQWYNNTVTEFHAFWRRHIINTYFEK